MNTVIESVGDNKEVDWDYVQSHPGVYTCCHINSCFRMVNTGYTVLCVNMVTDTINEPVKMWHSATFYKINAKFTVSLES